MIFCHELDMDDCSKSLNCSIGGNCRGHQVTTTTTVHQQFGDRVVCTKYHFVCFVHLLVVVAKVQQQQQQQQQRPSYNKSKVLKD